MTAWWVWRRDGLWGAHYDACRGADVEGTERVSCSGGVWQEEGFAFFSRRETPFSDVDVKDPKPKVKQLPVMRYAQGTALFIKARDAQDGEGVCLHAPAFIHFRSGSRSRRHLYLARIPRQRRTALLSYRHLTPSPSPAMSSGTDVQLGIVAESRFQKSLLMNGNDAPTLCNYGFLIDSVFKTPCVYILHAAAARFVD